MSTRLVAVTALAALGSLAAAAAAQPGCAAQKLLAFGPQPGENFGRRIAIAGDRLAIAKPLHDTAGGADAGAVDVYRLKAGAWVHEAEVTAADGAANDQFGFWVALDGDRMIVGAKFDDDLGADSGSAYVFRREALAWVQEAKLTANDGLAGDIFGNSVALQGDLALVGAPQADSPLADAGAAYVFQRTGNTWSQVARLVADDPVADDEFAFTVALDGGRALIGAWLGDTPVVNCGFAYVFRQDGTVWVQEAKLIGADLTGPDRFGIGVALKGDLAVVGADLADPGGLTSAGATYVYRRSGTTWAHETTLTASDAQTGNEIGFSVATDGNVVLSGAINGDSPTIVNVGAAYLHEKIGATWVEHGKLLPPDGLAGDLFGCFVALHGNHAFVGARQHDIAGTDAGAAYAFPWRTCTCYPDCDESGALNVNDYICFQTKFALSDPYSDCDGNGVRNVNDYICFQTNFALGC